MAQPRIGWAVASTLFAAFALTIFPLPAAAESLRPDWVLLTVIFWIVSLPSWIGIGVAWLCGIVLDTLTGALLGQHAAALALVAYIVFVFHRRIRVFPIWQETFAVFVFLILYHLVLMWVEGTVGQDLSVEHLLPVVSGVIAWPLWAGLLNAIVRQTR
ncbi:MAG: rod shape-determining protein MreD [Gammaproteobacteria bacterium]